MMLISIWEYTINKVTIGASREQKPPRGLCRGAARGRQAKRSQKEPFTGQANSTTVNTPTQIYTANGTSITGGANLGGYTFQPSSVSQLYTAINTPTTHYYGNAGTGANDHGWISSNPDSWTRANNPAPSTSKSIFDPCPYGYRVPTSNANATGNSDFFGFLTPPTWSTNIVNGMQFLGSWWPTSGRRNYNSATLGNIGGLAYYWSASPYPSNAYQAYNLNFGSGNVNPVNNYNRSYGFPVRCVQE